MIYAYIRVSTEHQTTDTQRYEIQKYCSVMEIHVDEWIDESISGTKEIAQRKLQKIIRDGKAGDKIIMVNGALVPSGITNTMSVQTI
jgi:DNA invertase Pin-like site-specific DNA recombinase